MRSPRHAAFLHASHASKGARRSIWINFVALCRAVRQRAPSKIGRLHQSDAAYLVIPVGGLVYRSDNNNPDSETPSGCRPIDGFKYGAVVPPAISRNDGRLTLLPPSNRFAIRRASLRVLIEQGGKACTFARPSVTHDRRLHIVPLGGPHRTMHLSTWAYKPAMRLRWTDAQPTVGVPTTSIPLRWRGGFQTTDHPEHYISKPRVPIVSIIRSVVDRARRELQWPRSICLDSPDGFFIGQTPAFFALLTEPGTGKPDHVQMQRWMYWRLRGDNLRSPCRECPGNCEPGRKAGNEVNC